MDSCLKKYIIHIRSALFLISKTSKVLKTFYKLSYKDDITNLDKLDSKIKNGMLNIIESKEINDELEKYKNFPDLDHLFKLTKSIIFLYFYETKKAEDSFRKEQEILDEAKSDFQKLTILFDEDWNTKIDENIIKCYKALKSVSEKDIKEELVQLKKLFDLEVDQLYIEKLKDQIVILSRKEELLQTTRHLSQYF